MDKSSDPARSGPASQPGGTGVPIDSASLDPIFGRVYDELRRLAHTVRGGRGGDTLNTTSLVHEAYLKLASARSLEIQSRAHFFAVAARAMRQILVDAARAQLAQKRGGGVTPWVTLDESMQAEPMRPVQVVALDDALARLEKVDTRRAQVVEQRIFAGLTVDEIATLLGVSRPTVERDWRAARAWLAAELSEESR